MEHQDIRNFKQLQFSGTSMQNVKDLKKRIEKKLNRSAEIKGLGKIWGNGLGEELPTILEVQFNVSHVKGCWEDNETQSRSKNTFRN